MTFTARSIGTSGNITVTLEYSGSGITVTDDPANNEVRVVHGSVREFELRDAINAQSSLISCSIHVPPGNKLGNWAAYLARTIPLSGGENIVLDITWDEDVTLVGDESDFTLNDVEATAAADNANTVTVTWNPAPAAYATDKLDPIANTNTLAIAAGAVESDATGAPNLAETWDRVAGNWVKQ